MARNVTFVISPSITEVYRVLGWSKVFLHSREHELFGIVITEVMAADIMPVILRSGGAVA